jgi:hypothetical protein
MVPVRCSSATLLSKLNGFSTISLERRITEASLGCRWNGQERKFANHLQVARSADAVTMPLTYAKSKQEALTPEQLNVLSKLVKEWLE